MKNIITSQSVIEATKILNDYKAEKANLENRIIENEQWYKMRHWEQLRGGKETSREPNATSGWLFNSLLIKHADIMDNYPIPNVLPQEQSDERTAKVLSEVLPVIFEKNKYEQIYDYAVWEKLKTGTAVKLISWDGQSRNGIGDISISNIRLLNLFWEGGISDIQNSSNVFNVSMVDKEELRRIYPEKLKGVSIESNFRPNEYIQDEALQNENDKRVAVIDWYYKKNGMLHYCKYVGQTVLYSSENENPNKPFYSHNKYPFVFDVLFPEPDSPAGFGYIDVMKDDQITIDSLDRDIQRYAKLMSHPRYVISDNAGVNEEEFADFTKDFIHSATTDLSGEVVPLQIPQMSDIAFAHRQQKIDELKEISGNRDINQGGTSGLTSGTAISAVQEAGNKLSRDLIRSTYRAYAEECYFIIELIREFYDNDRIFRITNDRGETEFINFNNSTLVQQADDSLVDGLSGRLPIFDVKVQAQKKPAITREGQNEFIMTLYNAGFFTDQLNEQALIALDSMDFEGKEKLMQRLQNKQQSLFEENQKLKAQLAQTNSIIDAQNGTNLSQHFDRENQGSGSVMPVDNSDNGEDSASQLRRAKESAAVSL